MSTDADDDGGDHHTPVEIILRRGEDLDLWIAEDTSTGVTSQGPTREDALANLDEALDGFHGAGDGPTGDDLADLGIDPDANTSSTPTESDPFDL